MTEAWVTLATSDGYAIGALVLAHSLKVQHTTKQLHCMVTSGVSQQLREELAATFDAISMVDVLNSEDTANLRLIGRPDLGVTFTKIHCWRLTQYSKCVFLDADCLVLQNADELFDHEELSAVADIGWPDCFNSGVFVYRPSEQTYSEILNFSLENGSFDGGDQGLLNMFFKDWRDKPAAFRLPFIYNMTSGAIYTYAAAFKKFGSQVKIVHFLGPVKPWQQTSNVHFSEHLAYWWSLFKSRLTSNLITSHVSSPRSSPRSSSQRTTEIIEDVPAVLLPRSGPPDPLCMRVFRCIPPSYGAWRPLRHPPTHLANQMAVFSLGPVTQLSELSVACSEIPGVAFEPSSPPTDEERMRAWEVGHPDYLGADAFDNIQKAIDHALE
ncbi:hypothetical protein X798_03965 [Onchocerca flexuosa]|uniref:glycogenin glucosyltransferase n=1 Tax=Onchocerca flexuosa TaxID=387005 RepID=A0A238BVN8_9BILA|nr:hypothetical protein X798_03965 [Onchocerca flexuosa]